MCEECGSCRWYSAYEGVCTNSESEYCADYMDDEDICPEWEPMGGRE